MHLADDDEIIRRSRMETSDNNFFSSFRPFFSFVFQRGRVARICATLYTVCVYEKENSQKREERERERIVSGQIIPDTNCSGLRYSRPLSLFLSSFALSFSLSLLLLIRRLNHPENNVDV